ncbi:MAG: S8 family serine peptidase, partial [Deltaproteobacteria bacterium]|nr:S8 family serine peptidase [Deltaproteobacteria bacterium]
MIFSPLTACLLLGSPSLAAFPTPAYPDCGEENLAACPSDFGAWELISWIPEGSVDTVRPEELVLGAGIAADVAFRHTTGRWESVVAVLDSGIYWQETDLWPKIHLNAGELPAPAPDVDGNGLLNISDYPDVDPTAGVDVADFGVDPSDLIALYSDGVDDDGNGYVDDIAGWDFFAGDNDPFADPQIVNADHGTGVMEAAGEAGDDGSGIGVCPNCAILPVRVGDTFVTQGDRIGLGLAFAADHRVASAAMAVGAMTHPDWTAAAVAWAQAEGVTLVGAAGDENSFHRNYPAAEAGILYVHSIRTDSADELQGAATYFNTWGCNNFGPRLDLVSPSGACATGAVANIAGAAGLVASAGLDAGLALTPDQIRGILISTADDVAVPEADRAQTNAWPSAEGWDSTFGYGRVNVGRAVEAVIAGDIPPVAHLDAPGWFGWAGDGVGVEVRGSTEAAWTLAIGAGENPSDWTDVASGAGPSEGALATVDLPRSTASLAVPLALEGVVARSARAHDRLVSIRLRTTDAEGRVGESRTAVWVEVDPDARAGFPLSLGSSIESAPVLADLDGQPGWEIAIAASNGSVHALDGSGASLPGFPVWTDEIAVAPSRAWADRPAPHEGILSGVAVGDVTGDGQPEIVSASLWGRVYAWSADGARVPGFPVELVGRAPAELTAGRTWDNGFA